MKENSQQKHDEFMGHIDHLTPVLHSAFYLIFLPIIKHIGEYLFKSVTDVLNICENPHSRSSLQLIHYIFWGFVGLIAALRQ